MRPTDYLIAIICAVILFIICPFLYEFLRNRKIQDEEREIRMSGRVNPKKKPE